jgi:hypothetical protein
MSLRRVTSGCPILPTVSPVPTGAPATCLPRRAEWADATPFRALLA